jgi:hypothetical protein
MGKVKLFWFSVLALRVGKNQMCLTVRLAFFKLGITFMYMSCGVFRHKPLQIKTDFGKSADFPNEHRPSHSLYTLLATGFSAWFVFN